MKSPTHVEFVDKKKTFEEVNLKIEVGCVQETKALFRRLMRLADQEPATKLNETKNRGRRRKKYDRRNK